MAEKCPICGDTTSSWMGNYRKDKLCKKHASDLSHRKIEVLDPAVYLDGVDDNDVINYNLLDYCVYIDSKTRKILNEKYIPTKLFKIVSAALNSKIKSNENANTVGATRTICVVCGNPTSKNGHLQCRDCYYETMDYMDGLNKNSRMNEFRDYYFNLKDVIFRMKNFDSVQSNCNKLIAIALQNQQTNSDTSLVDRVERDVEKLIETKRPNEHSPEVPVAVTEKDESKSNIYPTIDGHMVKSSMEQVIDDILWSANILHAYEQPINEFVNERKKCDWFIPITGTNINQGIYIEYWGMKTQKYLDDRKEKELLYKKYDVPYIGIEKDDPKDTHSFRNHLIQELQRLSVNVYGFMPKWKK